MNRYLISSWTGPTCVRQTAEAMRKAGLVVTCEGTEHVLCESEGSNPGAALWNMLAALGRQHGTSFGLRPEVLRRIA